MKYTIKFQSGAIATCTDGEWKSADKALLRQLKAITYEDIRQPFGYDPSPTETVVRHAASAFSGELISEETTQEDIDAEREYEEALERGEEIVY